MKQTPNYNLKKPDLTDYVNIGDLNDNMDVIDTELKTVKDTSSNNAKDIIDLKAHAIDYVKHPGFAVTSGTNNYTVTLNPKPAALVNGLGVVFRVGTSATGPCQLNVNGMGAKKIVDSSGDQVDDLLAGTIYTVRYNGSAFILQGKGGEDGPDVIKWFEKTSKFLAPLSKQYVYWVNTGENRIIKDGHSSSANGISIYDLNETLIHTQLLSSGFDMHASPTEVVQHRGGSNLANKILRIFDLNGTKTHDITINTDTTTHRLFGFDLERERIALFQFLSAQSGRVKFRARIYDFNGNALKYSEEYEPLAINGSNGTYSNPNLITSEHGMHHTFYNSKFGYGGTLTLLLRHAGVGYENQYELVFDSSYTPIPNII